ncbi:uncharacterized protein PV09_02061 [Verruconis gallopava]|uniref:Thymidylate kinase n=1 Tax=Verruconis gallopava TaxID=253628 RepID=A0A0D2AKX6_9PEZI|nr:uncharacterized protein PV09_02061 [Verruconis gallopava]KIW07195.1 hypothetical protein PV09_02061 [Verruconis gallopava]
MATYLQPRQPFAALDGSRLQALGSIKNRQNAIAIHEDPAAPPSKSVEVKSNKRAFLPDTLADEFDFENVDPNILASPSKKAKASDGTPLKASRASLTLTTTPPSSPAANRKAISLSVPASSNVTPISHSRGSPKHKRIGLLSKGRRASSSPFRRIDPPAFCASKVASLPFSIDAALSGTISSYKPAAPNTEAAASTKHMPKSWFFEIHEDTPEEEAANLMEHSASILDISSDDDTETKQRKLESEVGKENVPPPDWTVPASASVRRAAGSVVHKGIHSKLKAAQKEEKARAGDLMQDDRVALADMPREDFFPDGLDEKSVEIIPSDEHKLSGLSKETTFDFVAPSPEKNDEGSTVAETREEETLVRPDSPEEQPS